MLTDPLAIIAVLLGIEGGVLLLSDWGPAKRFFRYLPPMFWIYFLPMVANTAGLLPAGSPVYKAITDNLLPACLVLLLLSVDVRAILRLGPTALGAMLAGSVGTFAGAVITFGVFGPMLQDRFDDLWKGFGALSASWIGGSANMIAVARGTGTSENVLGAFIIVDTVVSYAWMAMLVLLAAYQKPYDRWNRSREGLIDELARRATVEERQARPATLTSLAVMLALAAACAWASLAAGRGIVGAQEWLAGNPGLGLGWLAELRNVINGYAWAIILVTGAGIALSFTPARRLESRGASKLGYAMLYFLLTAIGARTNMSMLSQAPALILVGLVWVCIHGLVLAVAGRLLRAPMSLLATASQANIGGPASAPVVAGIYQPGLAPVGLLLAILGNIIGTYAGLACTALLRPA